eukprot:CAMPEP_0114521962 /NCGR_PEP_ID=MMETSP0109-20121206/20490_1 /TAXON_ID=29199 /ORGANISM="Chlorarachnion reptans, Strain CCCM449" /LENGTH=474 /DNA_ID=CAMNT_0001703151 /DNA_START=354 /DNA_END=1775 /DNA_ORIENTATION=-
MDGGGGDGGLRVAIALQRFGTMKREARTSQTLKRLLQEEGGGEGSWAGSAGDSAPPPQGQIDRIQLLVRGSEAAIDTLNIPRFYAQLEDLRVFNPAEAEKLEPLAREFESVASTILAAWPGAFQLCGDNGDRKSRREVSSMASRIIIAVLPFTTSNTPWMKTGEHVSELTRGCAAQVIDRLARVLESRKCDPGKATEKMFGNLAPDILRGVMKLRRKGEREDLVLFAPVFAATVFRLNHPVVSEVFAKYVAAEMLRLIDQDNIVVKAAGARILAHCTKELLRTEIRYHGPLFLHRIQNLMAFHKPEVEEPTLVALSEILPKLDSKDKRTWRLAMDVMGKFARELDYISLSMVDEPLPRIFAFSRQLPRIISAMGHHTTRFYSTLLPALLRIALSSSIEISASALNSLAQLARVSRSRFRKHTGKIVEGICRAYLKHSKKTNGTALDDFSKLKVAFFKVMDELKCIHGDHFVNNW